MKGIIDVEYHQVRADKQVIIHKSNRSARLNLRIKTMILICLLLFFLLVIYLYGVLLPETAYAPDFAHKNLVPSFQHWFGTDWLGRDMFARTLKGMSFSLSVGIFSSIVSTLLAVFLGASAALGSFKVDACIGWVIDLLMGIPHLILFILISFYLGGGMKGIVIGIVITHWTSLARLIRSDMLAIRSQPYILISKGLGKSNGWILRNHFLPHIVPTAIIGSVLMFPHAIIHESSITFLGFGLPPEQPSIGIILSESMQYLSSGMWWLAVFPGALLVLVVFLIDQLGEQLRKILSPFESQNE